LYTALQTPGGDTAARACGLSFTLRLSGLLLSEWFARRVRRLLDVDAQRSGQETSWILSLDACFELPTPGVVALSRRSGCGKSTLVNAIAGLLDADSGRVALGCTHVLLDTERQLYVPPEHRRIGYGVPGCSDCFPT